MAKNIVTGAVSLLFRLVQILSSVEDKDQLFSTEKSLLVYFILKRDV